MSSRRRGGLAAILLTATAVAAASAPQKDADLRILYEAHRWFALRDAIAHGDPPLFYRGVVEAAFNDAANAERDLRVVIQSDPGGADAFEARSQLMALAFRNGRYLDADQQLERLLAQKPDATSLVNDSAVVRVLARTPDQEVVERVESSVRLDIVDGHFLLPARVSGQAAEFMFDASFNLSIIGESEAKRLGLDVQSVESARVTTGVPVVVGHVRLANVAFLVVPDSEPALGALAAGQRGAFGLPVLLALKTLRWRTAARSFDCAFDSGAFDLSQATVAFDDVLPLRRSGFETTLMDVDGMPAGTEKLFGTRALGFLTRAQAATIDFGRMTMVLQ